MQIYKSLYYLLEVRQYFFCKTRVGAAKHRLLFCLHCYYNTRYILCQGFSTI